MHRPITLLRRNPVLLLLALPPLVLLAACGGMNKSGSGGSTGAVAGAKATLHTVVVKESEFKLALSARKLAAGSYTFKAMNVGHVAHALEIGGPGVSDKRTPTIQPGRSKSLTVTLKNGSYEIYCPVDGHRKLGMDVHVKVGGSAAATPAPAATTTSSSGSGAWG